MLGDFTAVHNVLVFVKITIIIAICRQCHRNTDQRAVDAPEMDKLFKRVDGTYFV